MVKFISVYGNVRNKVFDQLKLWVEGAHTILSGDLALSGVIWRMSAHQRPRAPSGGRPSEGRYRRLAGAALRFP